ncbi:MAG: ABC transporter ATP-binding protein [Clostridia bacterium]|nr:ABC transporter ATP-binding protein [Clostridia bacterium]
MLENGRISDRGTHAELSARPGLYQRIFAIQAGLEEEFLQAERQEVN